LGAKFTKWFKAAMMFGLATIATGFFFTLGQDMYTAGKEAITHSIPLPVQLVIPLALGITAVGLALYGFFDKNKKDTYEDFKRKELQDELRQIDEQDDPKERDGQYYPANV
jgi:hypothetical protein